jgi:hypothetical protein
MIDDEAICAVVTRLSRPHPSGGKVIERAAIMAEGPDSAAILTWIEAHDGQPEKLAAAAPSGGLHSARRYGSGNGGGAAASAPRRYVLPPGAVA